MSAAAKFQFFDSTICSFFDASRMPNASMTGPFIGAYRAGVFSLDLPRAGRAIFFLKRA